MSEELQSCPSCGAAIPVETDTCDLCGERVSSSTVQDRDDTDSASGNEESTPDEAGTPEAGESRQEPETAKKGAESENAGREVEGEIYCNDCGWENPPGANYCSQCGSTLQTSAGDDGETGPVTADLPGPASGAPGSDEAETAERGTERGGADERGLMTRQILMVVGTALALILALFFVTLWSQTYDWTEAGTASASKQTAQSGSAMDGGAGTSATGSGGTPEREPQTGTAGAPTLSSLVDQLGRTVDGSLRTDIDSLLSALQGARGDRRQSVRADLVRLYTGAGAPGRAALVQSKIAESTGAVQDQRRKADLLYKWMRNVEADGKRSRVVDVAKHVASAYESVVEERPDDLDAKTRMGEAYLLTSNPMKGIQAINSVLDADSTFVPARFQKGLALLQIGRLDQAMRQFEKVMQFTSESDPFYQQAQRAITVIRKNASESGTGSASRSN